VDPLSTAPPQSMKTIRPQRNPAIPHDTIPTVEITNRDHQSSGLQIEPTAAQRTLTTYTCSSASMADAIQL
jgi:hypothetical protein